MALIVAVHGIGQQFKGDEIIHREWWSALQSGLHLAGANISDQRQLVCPFYGHLFRKHGGLSSGTALRVNDVGNGETELLKLFWRAAAEAESERVPSPNRVESEENLARTPQFIQRALNALSRSAFWTNASQNLMLGDLRQVVQYFDDPDLRDTAIRIVTEKIQPDTRVVIGHSLGSVVAYEALCRDSKSVASFVSLGSPLGIRNLIFDRLRPPPNAMGVGAWPDQVEFWTNIVDVGDVVAVQKRLAPLFGNQLRDVVVFNGSEAHHGERYLTTLEAGDAVRQGICPENS